MKRLSIFFLLLTFQCRADIKIATGYLQTGTGAATTQISVTGLSFQPKAEIFWWTRTTSTTNATSAGNLCWGYGAAVDSTHRFGVLISGTTAATPTVTESEAGSNFIMGIYTGGQAVDGLLDFVSQNSDGFTVVVDDQFTQSYTVQWLALGGSSITNAYVGVDTLPTSGSKDFTGIGFQPDFLLCGGTRSTSDHGSATTGFLSLGVATSSAQWVLSEYTQTAVATSNTQRYFYSGGIYAQQTSGSIAYRASLTGFISDGFTLNMDATGGQAYKLFYLALKGGNYTVGSSTTKTDGTDIIISGLGYKPTGGLVASHNTAMSTSGTKQDHASMSLGAFASASSRGTSGAWSEDNKATDESAYSVLFDAVYTRIAADDTLVGAMDIKSMDSDGVTFVMDDADPDAAAFGYILFGPAPGGGINPSMLRRRFHF